MKKKTKAKKTFDLLSVTFEVPQPTWTLERLTETVQVSAKVGAVCIWMIGRAILCAEKHFNNADGWQEWQTKTCGKSYPTVRRYVQVADRLTYAQVQNLSVQEAYNLADIPTTAKKKAEKPKGTGPESAVKKLDVGLGEKKKQAPKDAALKPYDPPELPASVVEAPDELTKALIALVERWGLEQLKERVDAIYVARGM